MAQVYFAMLWHDATQLVPAKAVCNLQRKAQGATVTEVLNNTINKIKDEEGTEIFLPPKAKINPLSSPHYSF